MLAYCSPSGVHRALAAISNTVESICIKSVPGDGLGKDDLDHLSLLDICRTWGGPFCKREPSLARDPRPIVCAYHPYDGCVQVFLKESHNCY